MVSTWNSQDCLCSCVHTLMTVRGEKTLSARVVVFMVRGRTFSDLRPANQAEDHWIWLLHQRLQCICLSTQHPAGPASLVYEAGRYPALHFKCFWKAVTQGWDKNTKSTQLLHGHKFGDDEQLSRNAQIKHGATKRRRLSLHITSHMEMSVWFSAHANEIFN